MEVQGELFEGPRLFLLSPGHKIIYYCYQISLKGLIKYSDSDYGLY